MKILQLCKKFPFPLKDGESIAVTYLARAMAELGASVTLLAMNTRKHWVDTRQLPPSFDHYQALHTVEVDNRIRPVAALRNLFSDRSYHIERFEDAAFEAKLAEVLQNDWFDIIQLETIYLAPYIPVIRKYSGARIVLRAHNVEHEIWERVAANSNPLKKWYLNRITPRLKRFEVDQINLFDLLVGISPRDVEHFRRLGLKKPAVVAPIGLDTRDYMADPGSFARPMSLAFIGSLDWMPNLEGLRWFLDQVWTPLLSRQYPGLEFHIAGRHAPAWVRQLRLPGVVVHGEVPDAAAFINAHSVLVVPLLSGGGMRAKILEAMALGKVVVSTRIGMEGIDTQDRVEALLADSPAEWLSAVGWCRAQGPQLETVGQRAQIFFASNYDNLALARTLLGTYRALLPEQPAVQAQLS